MSSHLLIALIIAVLVIMGLGGLVKVTLPNYLSNLPIPDKFSGWFHLSFKDWLALVPPTAFVAGLTYMSYKAFCPLAQCKRSVVNSQIQKGNPKVVDNIDIEDIEEKAVLCRCWKSKKWPYCDGSHNNHNTESGDNVGPVIVKRKQK